MVRQSIESPWISSVLDRLVAVRDGMTAGKLYHRFSLHHMGTDDQAYMAEENAKTTLGEVAVRRLRNEHNAMRKHTY